LIPGSDQQPMRADAVIVGAGPAGCAAAIGLARSGGRVVLYRRKPGSRSKPGEILDPTARIALAEFGLDTEFDALNSLTLAGSVSLWDSDTPTEVDGVTSPYGYGVLIDRTKFEQWLVSEAVKAGVTVLTVDQGLRAETVGSTWRLASDAGAAPRHVVTPLILQATGRANGLVGPRKRDITDRLVALLMYGPAPTGLKDQRLLIEASEMGWWYAAPLPDARAVVVFMTDADLLPPTSTARAVYFRAHLRTTRLISAFAAQMPTSLPMVGFPANSGIRQVIHGHGWAFIGDAAATYDPLSGRGVALALTKGASIARLVSRSSMSGALGIYADAERATFADYCVDQRKTYHRAAVQFRSTFWARRQG
jgi:flavin-dependent dehydrogenase